MRPEDGPARADALLVARGLAPSRTAAQRLIETGRVSWLGTVIGKPSQELPAGAELRVTEDEADRYVSRGGLKLAGALAKTGLTVAGKTCLDVGQSTGGFTDVLLARGAARVIGVDVGHGQLHPRLRSDPRVTAIEGVNARHLDARMLPTPHFDLIVADLSFISLTLVLPALAALATRDLLLLVKPQFELQPADIGKGGLVTDATAHARVQARLRAACAEAGLTLRDYFESAIAGGEGNREYFVWAHKT